MSLSLWPLHGCCVRDPSSQGRKLSLWLTGLTPCLFHGSPGGPGRALPAAQPQLPQGQGTSPPPPISSSSSQGLSGSGREGISRPKPPSCSSAVSLVSLASPGGVQEVLQCSGVRAKTNPVAEVRNEASTLGTPVLRCPSHRSLWLARLRPPGAWDGTATAHPLQSAGKARQGIFPLFLLTDKVLLK